MKIMSRFVLAGVFIVTTTAGMLVCASSASAVDVVIPDASFKACINERLGQAPDAAITVNQAESLDALECHAKGIVSIEGIQSFTNLTYLMLGNNQINNVAPLAALSRLDALSLAGNQISDIAPLAGLNNLFGLFLGNNQISDVSSLVPLENLEQLSLAHNQISDIAPLAELTNLGFLFLDNNQISDLAPLAHLVNLRSLFLNDNLVSDVTPLANLGALEFLWLYSNQISDVSSLYPAAIRGTEIRGREQTITLPPISAGVVQETPLIGYSGRFDRVPVSPQSGSAEILPGGLSWTYTTSGSNTLTWEWVNTINPPQTIAFSGQIVQESTPSIPPSPNVLPEPNIIPGQPGANGSGQLANTGIADPLPSGILSGALALAGVVLWASRLRARR
ncbi:leucine-rich repeat domain-containing protein [Lysinibacter sp. HNR]|uniref:leucine-rich repeat domain-containing protein n=1 Tax=Lysinibacter sp. HNR TaxID=3031408 RepID=UPI0024357482|nr:leucine-rich repeat domain-containing protein [Lysinibacter sp. HNR]WGD37605.1 leucine-rich repeat domain-containing protein [Lysinibacter sp. HNR]